MTVAALILSLDTPLHLMLQDLWRTTLEAQATAKLAAGSGTAAKKLGTDAAKLRKDATKNDATALAQVIAFHHHLCGLTVLDPACGTANFLYVTMEHMKRLEAEVLQLIAALGGNANLEMQGFRVRPEHFIGLEINKQAVAIAQLVLWIGYFQWQHKTTGKADTGDRPLLPKDRSIFEQDAVLAYDQRLPRLDPATGEPLTLWDGHSTKPHPITGKEVPDETARIPLYDYQNPRRADWPQADYIVGNPPFLGKGERMRDLLGDGYVEALRKAWKGDVPDSADLVMFWWRKAAELVRDGKAKRFGLITTNSIHQTFNRRVLEPFLADAKKSLHLAYAIPDHPWIDSADGAAVRIAMTVASSGKAVGQLEKVITEQAHADGENEVTLSTSEGRIAANLQIGADLTSCAGLVSNTNISSMGMMIRGGGFIVSPEVAAQLQVGIQSNPIIKPYVNGRDLLQTSREAMIIDAFGLTVAELADQYPSVYQHLLVHVKPERDSSSDRQFKELWWLFGRWRPQFRSFAAGITRYLATVETAKHRLFIFLDSSVIPDHRLITFGFSDAFHLGILSSQIHVVWALASGGRLEDRPVYNKSRCFEPFPFPALEEGALKQRIRDLGERLDAHRKRQQALHPDLTLTGLYNVLEKLRAGEALTPKERDTHDQGLVSVLKQIHDDLDAAVLEAYGWGDVLSTEFQVSGSKFQVPSPSAPPSPLETRNLKPVTPSPPADLLAQGGPTAEALEQQLLTRLVTLNHERAAEEQRGHIRYLRPDYQAPDQVSGSKFQVSSESPLPLEDAELETPNLKPETLLDWPADLPAQVTTLRRLLPAHGPDAETLSACFGRKSQKRSDQIQAILTTLRALGLLAE